ncbi:MAG: NAD-dependent epimerase/dehydratase family protein [Bacteroidia bacterium]
MIFAITGANGFLGVHIIHHLLSEGHEVKGIVRPGASMSEFENVKVFYDLEEEAYGRLEWCSCTLYDMVGLEYIFTRVDYVMHLAGVISYLQRDFDYMLEVNQQYTANVVNACLSSDVQKLLYCSSIAAVTKTTNGDIITEDIEWNNEVDHSNYGYTKHLGEFEIWRGREEGLKTVAINPGIILGYGDWNKGSNKLFKNAAKQFPFYSRGITGWVGVTDVARIAFKLCMDNAIEGRFILVSENKSFQEVSRLMATAFEVKEPWVEVKGVLYNLVYGFVSLKEALGLRGMLSKETVRASVSVNRFDNSKVSSKLEYSFENIEEVVNRAVMGYKKSPL